MSYEQWRALKDSVKTSMHWATPKTSGRMLDMTEKTEEPLSLNPSPLKEEDLLEDDELSKCAEENEEFYEPIPYSNIPFRMATPPFEEWSDSRVVEKNPKMTTTSTELSGAPHASEHVAMRRRQQFAVRRQSTIGAMVMAEKWEDSEIRRRFRNYEI